MCCQDIATWSSMETTKRKEIFHQRLKYLLPGSMCLNEKIAESFILEVLVYFETIEIPELRSVVKNQEYFCYNLASNQISNYEFIPNTEIESNFIDSFELIEELYQKASKVIIYRKIGKVFAVERIRYQTDY